MIAGRRRGLAGLLAAQAVSLTGTRLSLIALPWFVLTTTGSATQTGLVAFCEMAPYVVVKALAGPVIDRVGSRRVSVAADALSAPLVATIPLLHALDLLPYGVVLVLVAGVGMARGPGDAAKSTMVPGVAAVAEVPIERVTGLYGTVDRLAQTVGPLVGGVLVAWVGPLVALVADAGSFAVAGALIAATGPRHHQVEPDGGVRYLQRLRAGLGFLRGERLLRTIVVMVTTTNLIDSALFAVVLPVWARDSGGGPAAIGALGTAFGVTAVLGSMTAAGVAHRLPRRATYLGAFVVAGAPRIAVLALDVPLWTVVGVWAVSGLGGGLINPILSTVIYERIPGPLLGRVVALLGTLAWAGIPLGGPVGGVLVALLGLNPAVVAAAVAYFAVTTLPALRPGWREMDRRRTAPPEPTVDSVAP